MEKQYKIYLIIFISLLLNGCSHTNINQEKNKIEKKETTYSYLGQKLAIPTNLQGKLFLWDSPLTKFYPEDNIVGGIYKDNRILIKKNQPTFTFQFKGNKRILKLKFKHLPTILKIKNSKSIIQSGFDAAFSSPFQLINELTNSRTFKLHDAYDIAISTNNKKWTYHRFHKDNFDKNERAHIIKINNKSKTNNVKYTVKVISLYEHHRDDYRMKRYTYYPDELSFYVKDLDVEKNIIKFNLQNRVNTQLNEELIRSIAINNPRFFRQLQYNKVKYNLDSMSLLNLPNDVSVSYALKNFSKIIRTGKYLTYKNRYKSFNVKKNFRSSKSYKKTVNKLYVDKSNSKLILNKKSKNNLDNTFIDFDKGL